MRIQKRTKLLMGVTAIGCSLSFMAQPVLAAIDELIVTAERREASVQKTGIAITAFTGDDLDKLGIEDVQNVANYIPGMIMGNEASDFKVMIRGVGADNLEAVSDPGVALNIDGVYQGRPSGFNAALYDSQRLEVLRGPQGTLYGRNATGGAVNVISNLPDASEFSGGFDVTLGDYDRQRGRGFVNVPIVQDKLAVRLTGVIEDRDGYETNLIEGGTEGDDADMSYLRGQVLFQPSDGVSLVLRAHRSDYGGVGQIRKRTSTAPCTGGTDADDCGYVIDPTDLHSSYKDTAESRDLETSGYSAELNWDIGDTATLTFIAAYEEREFDLLSDSDQAEFPLGGGPGGASDVVGVTQDSDQTTYEIRLASQAGGDLDWIVGGFYFDENAAQTTSILRLLAPPAGTSYKFINPDHDVDSEAWGIFGQVSYMVREDFKLTGGLRYSSDEKSGTGGTAVVVNPPGPPPASCVSGCLTFGPPVVLPGSTVDDPLAGAVLDPYMPSVSFESTTWKIGADWELSEDNLLFASVSTGFKAGGFNFGADALTEYDPEEVLAIEIGSKNRFRDDTVQLNASIFHYDYSDQQIIQVIDQNINVQNADSTVYGAEVEGIFQATDRLQFDGHLSYLHARIDDFTTGDQARPGLGALDLSGNTLTNAPDLSGHLGVQYTHPLANSGALVARVNTYYQDDVYLRVFNTDSAKADSHTKTNASLRFEATENTWFGEVGVNNIEDEDVLTNMEVTDSGIFLGSVNAPRTWFVRFGLDF